MNVKPNSQTIRATDTFALHPPTLPLCRNISQYDLLDISYPSYVLILAPLVIS